MNHKDISFASLYQNVDAHVFAKQESLSSIEYEDSISLPQVYTILTLTSKDF